MSQAVPPPFPSDDLNPYAPPRSDFASDERRMAGDLGPVSFSIGDIWSRSWQIYRDRTGFCIGVIIGCGVLNFLASMVLGGVQQVVLLATKGDSPILVGLIAIVGNLVVGVFQLWILLGQIRVMIDVARGRETSFGTVFSAGPYLIDLIVAYIVFFAIGIGLVAVGAIPGGVVWAIAGGDSVAGPIVLGLGLLAVAIVGVIIMLRLSQVFYLIVDRGVGAIGAMRLSNQITKGYEGSIFVIGLIAVGMGLAGLLACGVGLIYTIPFTSVMYAVTYLALSGQSAADPFGKGEPLAELEPL